MNTYHAAHWSDISYSSSEEDEDKRYSVSKLLTGTVYLTFYFQHFTNFPIIILKRRVLINVSFHLYFNVILKNSKDSFISLSSHFFILFVLMQNPKVPYLCSQLASVTKGLCKQLPQANRFLPLQKNC